jgi:hypothetical protein
MAMRIFPDLALSEKFDLANMVTLFLLEGMAMDRANMGERGTEDIAEKVKNWLKVTLKEMLSDVEGIDRESAIKENAQIALEKGKK